MSGKETDQKFEKVLRELTDSVLEASDQEILDDARAEGIDVARTVAEFRATVGSLLQQRRREALARSHAEWEAYSLVDHDVDAVLPATAEARRSLLERAIEHFKGRHDLRLTLQFRDFRELSDEDVTSRLRRLIALNVPLNELNRMETDGDES